MKNNEILSLEEQFARECKVINLKYEYTGYNGAEEWAIVSELSSDELMEKYSELVAEYIPFIRLSVSQGEVINEFNRNEDKHKKRAIRYGSLFDVNDGEFEQHHPEVAYEPNYIEMMEWQESIERLYQAMSHLSLVQKERLVKYFFEDKNYSEIADEEGVSHTAIRLSIISSLEKIKKYY